MQAYLKGSVLTHTKDGAIVLVGDIGYECLGNWLKNLTIGTQIELYTYHYLENQSIPRLIAVKSAQARELLIQLLDVSGVGPKMAGRILDSFTPSELISAITSGDITLLSHVKGLGKKTAQKIILELGKTLVFDSTVSSSPYYDALISLGFGHNEIETAIKATDTTNLNENQALSAILRSLGGKR